MTKKTAFTLAEVLITLSILGVIAAISIPNIIHQIQNKITVSKVKIAYSLLDNALRQIVVENGNFSTWNWPVLTANGGDSQEDSNYLINVMSRYLNVKRICRTDQYSLCLGGYKDRTFERLSSNDWFSPSYYKNFRGGYNYNYGSASLILKNGMSVGLSSLSLSNKNPTGLYTPNDVYGGGNIFVDIDGPWKGENRIGYDVFYFVIKDNGELGLWTQRTTDFDNNCNPNKESSTGKLCSAWIIKHGNTDYKKRNISSEW